MLLGLHARAEWSSVLSRCFSLQSLFFAMLALGNLYTTFTKSTSLAVSVMMDGTCRCFLAALFGLLFGVESLLSG